MKKNRKPLSSGKLIAAAVIYMVLILALTLFFWGRSRHVTNDLLESEMVDVARCAAATVDGDALLSVQSDDKQSPEFQTVFGELSVYLNHTEAQYIYAMRRDRAGRFSFVVDTDPVEPGEFGEVIETTDAMISAANGTPDVDEKPSEDRWGIFYSAYCPVYSSTGAMAGVIGVDFPADWYETELSDLSNRVVVICTAAILISVLIMILILWQARREAAQRLKERDELQIAKADAIEANEEKNRFLANMSREVRTPIDKLLNMDEMILRESVEPEIREHAVAIRHAGNELLSLMEEVLDMSQVESEETDINPVRYDPVLLVTDLSDMVKARVHEKKINVFTEIDDKLPTVLLGDSTRIKQCLINLATNSVKFTEEGEIHLSVERVRVRDNSVWLKFAVRDTGGGISEEETKKVLSAMEDIGEIRYTEVEGVAMSLNIVHHVLMAMGSRLEFETKLGEGSTFFFVLRQKVVDERPVGEFEKAREVMSHSEDVGVFKPYTAPDARILLVDDAKMNLKLVQQLLVDTQITVDTTDSGAMALEMLAQTTYDVLIFDHMMPEIDGIELLRLVRENRENPNCSKPCLVLTGNTIDGAREEYLRVGFDAYLGKPVKKDMLEGILRQYLPANKIKTDEFARPERGGNKWV